MFKDRDDGENSIAQSRERRRLRIEMRRMSLLNGVPPSEIQNLSENHIEVPVRQEIPMAMGIPVAVVDEEKPVFGLMSVAGRSRDMEDTIDIKTSLCRLLICHLKPVHYFAVFDGRGGSHVAALCRENMHEYLLQELMRSERGESSSSSDGKDKSTEDEHHLQQRLGEEVGEYELWWRRVMKRSFERMDCLALSCCPCGFMGLGECGCHCIGASVVGSSAVVAVLTPYHIVVASCGDSRSILCRAGMAIPLAFDHKPAGRPYECGTVKADGGRVISVCGTQAQGMLAMSGATGEKFLKPGVISEPDITYTKRHPEDDCLILATDGMWNFLSNEMACEVACRCLREGKPESSSVAAALLTRLAFGRKSVDNVSVIVIDLRRHQRKRCV